MSKNSEYCIQDLKIKFFLIKKKSMWEKIVLVSDKLEFLKVT